MVKPSSLMPVRRRAASVPSNARTARSAGTSPHTGSRIFLPELPKNSPTVVLNNTPESPASEYSTGNPRAGAAGREPGPEPPSGCKLPEKTSREEREIQAKKRTILQGEVVTLRPPRESDAAVAYAWDRDPELAAWNGRAPISVSFPAARRDYLARWKDRGVKTFIIEAEDEPIGMATLYDFRRGGCELGIKIGPQKLRGRGYASEAVELLVDYAFADLGLQTVRGSTLVHNTRMRRVFEKSGFVEVGDGSIISRYDNRRYTELFYELRRYG